MLRIRRARLFGRVTAATLVIALALPLLSGRAVASVTFHMITLPENLGFAGFAAGPTGVSVIGTMQAGSGVAGDCDVARLATNPLGVGQATIRLCSDPALWAEPIAPVQSLLLPSYNETLRVARRVDGAIRLGPVLSTYQENSGSHPLFAYGAGSLWIYEEQGPGGATVFRVSLTSGALIAAVRSPDLTRPLLVADDDGAWIIPAGSFGAVSDVAIYHLAPGSDHIVPALSLPNYNDGFAMWAVAAGHAVDVDLCARPIEASSCEMYGLAGTSAKPIIHRPSPFNIDGLDFALAGPNAVYVLASENLAANSPSPYRWVVERVDASTGKTSTVATALLPEYWEGPDGTQQPDAIVVRDSIFLLSNPDSTFPDRLEEIAW